MRLSVLHPLAFCGGDSPGPWSRGGKRKGRAGRIPARGRGQPLPGGHHERSHRLRAASIDPEADLPQDMEAFRYRLARMILMYVNDWPGCPLPICRRMRGCMAPENVCANNADDPPATQEEWDKVRFEVRRALDERMAERGLED